MTGVEPIIVLLGIIQLVIVVFAVGKMLLARRLLETLLIIGGFIIGLGPLLLPPPEVWWVCGAVVVMCCLIIALVATREGHHVFAFLLSTVFFLPILAPGFGRADSADIVPLIGALQILLSPIMCAFTFRSIGRAVKYSSSNKQGRGLDARGNG